MPALKHIHTYRRVGNRSSTTYMCAHPDCFHRMHKQYLCGKRSICAICHMKEIVLTPAHLQAAMPRCDDCSTGAKSQKKQEIRSLLDELLAPDQEVTR